MQLEVLAYCLLGSMVGSFVGVLPGIGAMAAISLLLLMPPHIMPEAAANMLARVNYGAQHGGAIASILVRLPGYAAIGGHHA